MGVNNLESLRFLKGCWRSNSFELVFTGPAGGVVLGTMRELAGPYFEFFRFFEDDGETFLHPYACGERSGTYRLVSVLQDDECRVSFEDPGQRKNRVIYFATTADRLTLRAGVEGVYEEHGNQEGRVYRMDWEFPYASL